MVAATGPNTKYMRLKWRLAFEHWRRKATRWVIVAKAGFDPNQPRVPAGNPDGGQWTSTGGGRGTGSRVSDEGRILSDANPDNLQKPGTRLVQARRGRSSKVIRFGRHEIPATQRQRSEYSGVNLRADAALKRVKEIDPNWKPRPSPAPPQTAREAIAIRRGEAREAEARLQELARQSPSQLIGTYRTLNNSRDLFGNETWPRNRDTVAITTIGRTPFAGVSSNAPTYTARDRETARVAVDTLVARYPDRMNTRNIGGKPNNALYHAEATILLRAARAHRGSLAGQRFEVHTDRPMCRSCRSVLPKLGQELGNPTVTFVSPLGTRRTMRDGRWID